MNKRSKAHKKKQSGMSLIESLPLIMVIASLIGFVLGLWGVVHKSILHSIAARNYAFETFNHRANLVYFNDFRSNTDSYEETGLRFHSVGDNDNEEIQAFTIPYRFPAREAEVDNRGPNFHTNRIWQESVIPTRGEAFDGTRRPWVMSAYGICLDSNCGG